MNVVLDTNVLVSGIFFSGPPYEILKAWRNGKFQIVVSPEIMEEYRRVGEILGENFPGVELTPFLKLLTFEARVVRARPLPDNVCEDPDDDKFLACAVSSRSGVIISGYKKLLKTSGYRGIKVVKPRFFIEKYL